MCPCRRCHVGAGRSREPATQKKKNTHTRLAQNQCSQQNPAAQSENAQLPHNVPSARDFLPKRGDLGGIWRACGAPVTLLLGGGRRGRQACRGGTTRSRRGAATLRFRAARAARQPAPDRSSAAGAIQPVLGGARALGGRGGVQGRKWGKLRKMGPGNHVSAGFETRTFFPGPSRGEPRLCKRPFRSEFFPPYAQFRLVNS